jgi:hypothetical protein
MSLILRRILSSDDEPEVQREDFEVIDERGQRLGRVYRTDAVGSGYDWVWTVYGIAVSNAPPAGRASTREIGMAEFTAKAAASGVAGSACNAGRS